MADLGLLAGIAEGLKSGVEGYRTERDYQDKKKKDAVEQALKNAQLKQMGYQVGDDGSVGLDEYGQLKHKLEQTQTSRSLQEYDPNSAISKQAVKTAQGLLTSADPTNPDRFNGVLPSGMSAADLKDQAKEGLLGKSISGVYGVQGRDIVAKRMDDRNQVMRDSLSLRKDTQASHAADTIHKDSRVIKLTQQLEQLERGRGILDQPNITNQEFNDYQQEIQAAISGAGGGALGKLERTEYVTLQGQLAALKQKITGQPQDAVPRELVERLKSLADHTRDVMAKHREDRATALQRTFRANPAANEEMGKAIETYKSGQVGHGLLGTKASQASNGPKVGSIEQGYRFIGGEPSDSKNWEKVQ